MTTTIEQLQGRLADAALAIEAAAKAGDVDAELRAREDAETIGAELRAEQTKTRRLTGLRLVSAGKGAAAGAYQVGYYDLADKLPQIDPVRLPTGGVVLFRSPTTEARKRYEARAAAAEEKQNADKAQANADAAIDLICACTLHPTFNNDDGSAVAYRVFWETTGRGLVHLAALHIQKLGGAQLEDFKSATR